MMGSKNTFFSQSLIKLKSIKRDMVNLLLIKGRSNVDIKKYTESFDFFISNPSKYDGATIVKDLVDIRSGEFYLDVDAMQHDYDYIKGANKSFIKKWKADVKYIKNMELNGKGVRIARLFLLTITGILFVPYQYLK